ncbi:MAG: preprotein translocase subunit SecD [Parcubacteria group bacterium Gr01-1014_56]|nr:MAG: preprotein translocase subunit SecD [Parcubacteria group bacterium Gr01-1014_56]
MPTMWQKRLTALIVLALGAGIGFFVYNSQITGSWPFKLGLDLSGGTHLVYSTDTSKIQTADVNDSLQTLREVIERRVNSFGVSEPVVQTLQGGALSGGEHRLVVELPGVTDVNEAVKLIGQTPLLEFKLVKKGFEDKLTITATSTAGASVIPNPEAFEDTGLTGKYLSRAALEFGSGGSVGLSQPTVRVDFNPEGAKIFSDLTGNNVGRLIAIFLDGTIVSAPVVNEKIGDGTAIISGNFSAESAKELVRNLNLGALPVPIALISTQSIGATLGDEALHAGVVAGVVGFIALVLFMLFWYRIPGLVAVVSLTIYVVLMLVLFKLIPVVLTAAGIAGFILSVGLAVDANVLIAERIKEELASGKKLDAAIREGFQRAWLAIRDSNIAHIIAGVILFWFGTSLIKGFALVFSLGVIVSMFSAITISRTFLLALGINAETKLGHFLMRSGLRK